MKTIRRIGLFLLAAVLCTFFSGCVPLGRMAVERMEESIMDYKDAMTFAAGNFTYAASEVRRVSVSWVGGSVKLEKGAGDTLRADESGMLSVPQQMHWRIKDGTLEIMYCASGYAGRFPLDAKALTLEIPAGADVTVRSVSAPVRGDALSFGDLTVSTCVSLSKLISISSSMIGSLNLMDFSHCTFGFRSSKIWISEISDSISCRRSCSSITAYSLSK